MGSWLAISSEATGFGRGGGSGPNRFKNLNMAGGKRVRLWVANEHRYGLFPVVWRCWTLRGVCPATPYQTKYEQNIGLK